MDSSDSSPQLTVGCLQTILSQKIQMSLSNPVVDKPIVQVLASKRIGDGQIRCQFFDGIDSYNKCVIKRSPQIDVIYDNNQLEKFSVLRLDQFWVSNAGNGDIDVLAISDITPLALGSKINKKLEPNQEEEEVMDISQVGRDIMNAIDAANIEHNFNPRYIPPKKKRRSNETIPVPPIERKNVCPISEVSPEKPEFVIRGRVTSKTTIRTFIGKNGKEGRVFSFDVTDDSSEIRITGFTSECDKYYDFIEKDMLYYISRGNVKIADRRWSNLKSDFEITLTHDSAIELCEEIIPLPEIKFAFVPIPELMNRSIDTSVDVIGVIHCIESVHKIVSKKNNKEYDKRDVTLVDKSLYALRVTIWNTEAQEFKGCIGQVMALKNGTVNEYCGKSLSCVQNSIIQLDPDLPEAHVLKGWYNRKSDCIGVKDLIPLSKARDENSFNQFKRLSQINVQTIPEGETVYYSCRATILSVNRIDKHLYKSCSRERCLKKVKEEHGFYFCGKCGYNSPNFEWRLMLGLNCADSTADVWVTAFQEVAEKLIGKSVEELNEIYDKDPNQYQTVINGLNFRAFIFKIGSKVETFNNEKRVKSICFEILDIDPIDRSKKLIQSLRKDWNQ